MSIIVRRATSGDVEAILDLLTEYDLPRAYFEPFYYGDPTYRPEQSWVVEVDARLAAHLRLFDRWIYLQGIQAHVAGVGNVITARAFRGRGFAGQLLRAFARDASAAGYTYSLLWTHAPGLYERYGWAPIEQERIYACVPAPSQSVTLQEFEDEDLPDVMRLYDRTNRLRSGPTVRSADYWRAQRTWTHEDRAGFLIARDDRGALNGYVRSRAGASRAEVIELGIEADHLNGGRELVSASAHRQTGGEVEAQLPRSLHDVIPRRLRQVSPVLGLMGRTLDAQNLFDALVPVLIDRAPAVSRIRNKLAALPEADLGHLLFHGYDRQASGRFAGREDTNELHSLFPEQDFIIWPSDAF
jgi:predicted N-acetyltransferase YhbS